jgi:hypothetical protein
METIEEIFARTPTDFMSTIEKIVEENEMTYIDAVIYYCEINGIELETAASLIKSSAKMKARIQNEAEENNLLPKTSRLPI